MIFKFNIDANDLITNNQNYVFPKKNQNYEWIIKQISFWRFDKESLFQLLVIFGYQSIDWFWTFNLWTLNFYSWEGKKWI